MRTQGLRSIALASLLALLLALTACSGDGGEPGGAPGAETWPGTAANAGNGDSISVGGWKGRPDAVAVSCSVSDGAVTATLTAPEGWTAVTTQPKGGGDAAVTLRDTTGTEETLEPHGDSAVRWGATATFQTEFPLESKTSDWRFYAASVSCEQQAG